MRLPLFSKMGSFGLVSVVGSILTPLVNWRLLPDPFIMNFVVTRRCNARCQMCNIWREKSPPSLSLDQIRGIFTDNDFSSIRSITLTGGEPTLRSDLPQIFHILADCCPHLEHLYLATNGLNVKRTLTCVERILELIDIEARSIRRFDVQVSLDGVGEIHDQVRGIEGFFDRVVATLDGLPELQKRWPRLALRLSCVVMPQNLPHLNALQRFAAERGLYVQYSPAILSGEYYRNLRMSDQLAFGQDDNPEAVRFFYDLARADETSLRFYYRDVARMLQGARRNRKCMMGFYAFVLEHDGEVYPCLNCESRSFGNLLQEGFNEIWFGQRATEVRRNLRRACCPTCVSMCYLAPVNAIELLETRWRKHIKPRLSRLQNPKEKYGLQSDK
jgi:MoaA/NifB/PqqE/SkfB family radical SAM enzyme